MKILILNWRDIKNPLSGGAEIILYELAKKLIEDKHTVVWFAQSFEGGLKEEVYEGIRIIRKGNKYSVFLHAFLYYKSLADKPDLVLDSINTVCWQTPLYVEARRRILYANQSAREVLFYDYPFPLSLFAFLIEPLQYLTYKNTKTVCYSQSIKDDLVSFGKPSRNINVFPLGIDHDRYVPGKKSLDPTFIFVSRFVRYKRAHICVEAMKMVIKEHPKVKLYLVGYGIEEKNLTDLIERLNLQQNVFIVNKDNIFLKKNHKDAKIPLMQEAWGLILPSVKEGWGMVVTEAAACATPAIVSNVTGLKDSVINGKTGIVLSRSPKAEELAKTMMRMIVDSNLRKKLSMGAYRWSKNFTWEKSYKVFLELIAV